MKANEHNIASKLERILRALVLVAVGSIAPQALGGPLGELYLTSKTEHGGGKSTITVVQGTTVNRSWNAQHGNEIPIAVGSTVRTLGLLNVPAPGDVGAEYSISGLATGTAYPMPISSPPTVQFLDGATDGVSHNFAWDINNNTAYQFDLNWANPQILFTLTDTNSRAGITFDPTNDSLWLSGYGSSTIEDRSLAGGLLSSFTVGHIQNTALAFDPADGTLWMGTSTLLGTFQQYSRSGQLLGSQFYASLTATGTLGGEFQLNFLPGDFNRDSHVNGADISAMMAALADLPAYKSMKNLDDAQLAAIGDVNRDGQLNNADLQSLLNLLKAGGGSMNSVPEPSSLALGLAVFAALGWRIRRNQGQSQQH